MGAQSFVAKLEYVSPETDSKHGDTIHITVEIPHQDGMIPVISTVPIYNIDYLLTQQSFAKQHICSNILQEEGNSNFLSRESLGYVASDSIPREEGAAQLYKHLDKISCMWKFEAWYSMTDLVNECGSRVVHNFDVEAASKSFVTVHQPLYVSYVYAKAPSGWASLDHQSVLEVSFYYDNVKFQTGAEVMSEPQGSVEILRVGITEDGKMSMQLRTQALFKGICCLR